MLRSPLSTERGFQFATPVVCGCGRAGLGLGTHVREDGGQVEDCATDGAIVLVRHLDITHHS